ncbi:hypothetical protein SAMN02745127_02165 [Oceanospirillum multiglobuliferum]|nr:hypothetical protein SAMN02745127_02165 [Oceanospirillum multiglobuliferum]
MPIKSITESLALIFKNATFKALIWCIQSKSAGFQPMPLSDTADKLNLCLHSSKALAKESLLTLDEKGCQKMTLAYRLPIADRPP